MSTEWQMSRGLHLQIPYALGGLFDTSLRYLPLGELAAQDKRGSRPDEGWIPEGTILEV